MNSEDALQEFSKAIAAAQLPALKNSVPPIVFICGAPRSGTTYLYQTLAYHGDVGYIDNMIARFFSNPPLGVRFSQGMDLKAVFTGRSEFGRTSHLTEPHEFGRGWAALLGLNPATALIGPQKTAKLPDRAVSNIKTLARTFGKPCVFKSFAYLWFIEELAKSIPEALWVNLVRDVTGTSTSLCKLYQHRDNIGGGAVWESAVLEKTIKDWNGGTLEEKTVRQIKDIQAYISGCFSNLPHEKKIEISYDQLCAAPVDTTHLVLKKFGIPNRNNMSKECL